MYNNTYMRTLLKNAIGKLEVLKGKELIGILAVIFAIFVVMGLLAGYVINRLGGEAPDNSPNRVVVSAEPVSEAIYSGKVVFVDAHIFQNDEVSFKLVDEKSKDIILLKTSDQKLEVVEGQRVEARGALVKTKDGKRDILVVSKGVLKNAN